MPGPEDEQSVDQANGLIDDPLKAEMMASTDNGFRDSIETQTESADATRALAEQTGDNRLLHDATMADGAVEADTKDKDPSVERVGEGYDAVKKIVDSIRARAETASTPEQLEAKKNMEDSLAAALLKAKIYGPHENVIPSAEAFVKDPNVEAAIAYADQAAGGPDSPEASLAA